MALNKIRISHLRKMTYLCKFLIARFTFPNETWIIDSFLNNRIRNFRIVTSLMKSFVTFVAFYQLVLKKNSFFLFITLEIYYLLKCESYNLEFQMKNSREFAEFIGILCIRGPISCGSHCISRVWIL